MTILIDVLDEKGLVIDLFRNKEEYYNFFLEHGADKIRIENMVYTLRV